MGFFYRARNYI